MKGKYIIDAICVLLIMLFGYTAISKLTDFQTFRVQLGQSPFISGYAGIISWAIPAMELAIMIMLIFDKSRLLALYLSLFLMTMFSAYIYAMLHYSYYIPCSCGGILEKLDWKAHLWFNLAFTALCITGILADVLPPHKSMITPE